MVNKKELVAYCGLYCGECPNYTGRICEKLKKLEANHGVAHIKNLRRIKRNGIDAFLDGQKHWYAKPKGKKD